MKRLLFFCISMFFCIGFIYPDEKYDFSLLNYNLSHKDVIKLWGPPDVVYDDSNILLYEYNNNAITIYINFYNDDSLSYVWGSDIDENYIEYMPFNHSFFENAKEKGKYKVSGYTAEKQLKKRSYTQKYFYFSQIYHEAMIMNNEGKSVKDLDVWSYAFQEDRIVYKFQFFANTRNNTVTAYIFNDKQLEREDVDGLEIEFIFYDKNNDGIIDEDEGDWFNNRYYLEIDHSQKNKYKKKFINFDINKDGKVEKKEGCYVYY